MTDDQHLNPQNPYASFVVAASAGSGKTYQLSRRFLFLVGAGAAPGAVLTVTFTKKAAGEMRARILEEAARLAADPALQTRFDAEMRRFHTGPDGAGTPPPKSARDVAETVLGASQVLKISTIDSLFLEWVSKFPFEAGGAESGGAGLPAPFDLLDPLSGRELDRRAFRATCQLLARGLRRDDPDFAALLDALPDGAVRELEDRLRTLDRQDTFLWYGEAASATGEALHTHVRDAEAELSDAVLIETLAAPLKALALALSDGARQAACLEAIGQRDFAGLLATGILTKSSLGVSGTYFRGKKRDGLAAEIAAVEDLVRQVHDQRRLAALERTGRAQYRLYRFYRQLRDHLKFAGGGLEFRDLVKGCYRLFHGDGGAGVRFLLARTVQHLLLDEFQDTSRLQWAVFGEMTAQMLAGRGVEDQAGPPPSVFIVGDAKQSIYGFREADPAVMGEAAATLAERLRLAPLTASYRTAQVVLDFVNRVFGSGAIADFPPHCTAADGGRPFVPDIGGVLVAPLLTDTDSEDSDAQEARQLAELLARAFQGELELPVYDKEERLFRQLRPGDCAVLYRSTTKAALFETALRRAGIPCQREEEKGFFARPEIADSLALLRFLALPADLVALATVLRSPLAATADQDLLELLAESKGSPDRGGTVLSGLMERDPPLGTTLAWLLSRADRLLPHELLIEALTRLDAFSAYGRAEFHPGPEGVLAQRNLLRLIELAMKLEDDGLTALAPLVERLDALAADDEMGNAAAPAGAVTLMTIHKAKGLEYPLVALVDSGRPWGRRDLYWAQGVDEDGRPGIYYIGRREDQPVADPAFAAVAEAATAATAAECQRLLYVALTRARQYLLVTGHKPPRSQGIAETTPYEQLAAAVADAPAGRLAEALVVGDAVWTAWRTSPPETVREAPGDEAEADGHVPPPLVLDPPDPGLPRELVVRSPSRHESAFGGQRQSRLRAKAHVPAPLAAAVGDFLHKALEAFMRDIPFDSASVWQATVPLSGEELQSAALAELDAVQRDPVLLRLKRKALRLEPELPLVHRSGDALVVGTLDLLVEDPDGRLRIIDYKTTVFDGDRAEQDSAPDAELRAFCRDRGWDAQLADYAAAVRALRPGFEVTTAVYFTSLRRLVDLSGKPEKAKAPRPAWRQLELFSGG